MIPKIIDTADSCSSSNLQIYTPLRRRGYTNNTTPLQADAGKEWTTARCHRLLRALTSRVSILTKDLARFSAAKQPETGFVRRVEEENSPDGDWNKSKKKIRQTYSSKGKKGNHGKAGETSRMLPPNKTRRSLNPGEVSVPTPILVRARREYSEVEVAPNARLGREDQNLGKNKRRRTRYALDDSGSSFQLSEPLREIRQKTSAARYTTYEGIYSGLEALLVATAPTKPEVKRKGARSLFSMALRAVPGYISQQEGLVEAHMEETGSKSAFSNRDMATEIYDDLEDFGSSGHGWKHLKIVVRSHGIQVLSEAIGAGVLEVDYVGCLITLCIRLSAMDEAQTLFSTLICSVNFAPPRSIYEKPNRLLSMLWKFTEHTESTAFQYRELLKLFSTGLLPIDWVATKNFGHVWTGLFQMISSGSGDIEALIFLDALLPMLSSGTSNEFNVGNAAISEATNNTFSSVLTTLSSIVILGDERQKSDASSGLTMASGSSKDIISLLKSCSTPVRNEIQTVGVLPLLSALVTLDPTNIHCNSALVNLLLEHLQHENGTNHKSYAQAVSFTCSTARCCGRGKLSSGFDHLQHMHRLLEECDAGTKTNVLKSLIVDSAFAFAEQSPDREHLQYAAEMDTKFCVRRFEPNPASYSLPDEGEHRSGFRWEEGIGEWVTASPLAAKKVSALVAAKENLECDTPYRPAATRRRNVEIDSLPPSRAASRPVEEIQIESPASAVDFMMISKFKDSQIYIEEQDHLNNSESDDELGLNSSQLTGSCVSDISFDSVEMSFAEESFVSAKSSFSSTSVRSVAPRRSTERAPRLNRRLLNDNQDLATFEDSSIAIASSAGSSGGTTWNRQSIDMAPRLGRKTLRSSQTWQIFYESDDELSFVSISSQDEKVLREVTNTSINTRRLQKRTDKVPSVPSKPAKPRTVINSDSEDELCM